MMGFEMIREAVWSLLEPLGFIGGSHFCRCNAWSLSIFLEVDHVDVWSNVGPNLNNRVATIYYSDPDFFVKLEELLGDS